MRSLAIDSSLQGIAGPPLAMLTVPNTASSPLDIGPTEARTLYAIGSTQATASSGPIANLGGTWNGANAVVGGQVIRSQLLGVGGLTHRSQTIEGAGISQPMRAGWPWDRPLAACGWWDRSRFGCQGYREAPTIGESSTGSMNAAPCLRLASISSGTTPIAALAYRGVHDLATRTRILSWLMQRYGTL